MTQDTNQDTGYRNNETWHTNLILTNTPDRLLQEILDEKLPDTRPPGVTHMTAQEWSRMDRADKLKDTLAEDMYDWINVAQTAYGNNPIMAHLLTHAFEAVDFYQIIKFNELKFFESESE